MPLSHRTPQSADLPQWPAQALDVAGELRRQLDDSFCKRAQLDRAVADRDEQIAARDQRIAELEAQCQVLRGTLLGEAELAEAQHEPHDKRGSAWWYTAWREVSRHRSELQVRVGQLERWLRDSGREATRLQTDLTAARAANDELTRRIADTEGDVTEQVSACDELERQLALSEAVREQLAGELARCEAELQRREATDAHPIAAIAAELRQELT